MMMIMKVRCMIQESRSLISCGRRQWLTMWTWCEPAIWWPCRNKMDRWQLHRFTSGTMNSLHYLCRTCIMITIHSVAWGDCKSSMKTWFDPRPASYFQSIQTQNMREGRGWAVICYHFQFHQLKNYHIIFIRACQTRRQASSRIKILKCLSSLLSPLAVRTECHSTIISHYYLPFVFEN